MAVIDVGSAATNRGSYRTGGSTNIDYANAANDTGVLDTFDIFHFISFSK